MIVGIGTDIVEISRLKEKQGALANRILTDNEKGVYEKYFASRKLEYLAGRFAAKEAIFKAMNDDSLTLSQIEVLSDEHGKPICQVDGCKVHISIAHEREYASAYALVEN